jgi:membrane protein implicated in regulation of membrane protease activity
MKSLLQIETARHYGRLEFIVGFLLHFWACLVPGMLTILAVLIAAMISAPRELALLLALLGFTGKIVVQVLFIPVFQVNPYIQAVIERTLGLKRPKSVLYDCQITLSPRLSKGLRRLLDDSDDVGRLEFTTEGLTFHGGCITLTLPFRDIESSKKMRTKARNLWIAGGSTRLVTSAFDGINHIEFGERQSRSSWNSRRISAEIAYGIEYGMQREREKRAEP